MNLRCFTPVILVATSAALAQGSKGAARAGEQGAFVSRLGVDTIAVESFRKVGNGYEIQQAINGQQVQMRRVRLELTAAGAPSKLEMSLRPIGSASAPPIASRTLSVTGDSVVIEGRQGDTAITPVRAAFKAGMLPIAGGFNSQSWLTLELGTRRARAARRDTVDLTFLGFNGQPQSWTAIKLGSDSMLLVMPFVTYRARVDQAGHILGVSSPGTVSTFHVTVDRVPNVDVASIAARWNVHPMGPASPADSVVATVGGANVRIGYSRPSIRGRTVWGGQLVPFDTVWRTGANAATTLTTDKDLVISGTTIPAGAYTLWTISTAAGSKLIVSSLTKDPQGQPLWGTMYDPKFDVARIDMTRATVGAPLEQFKIDLQPQSAGHLLTFTWGTMQLGVPVTVKAVP